MIIGTETINDNENNIWVSSTTGLSKFDGEKWETYKTTDGLLKNNVTVKCIDQEGNLWLKYNVNWSIFNKTIAIAKFDKMNFENIKYYSKRITHLNFINEDKNGNIWVGLNHKLMVYPKTDVVR